MRRLGSYIYDFLMAIAIYMLAGFISFACFGYLFDQQFIANQGHQHAIDLLRSSLLLTGVNELWKIFWVCFFFIYFWCKSGQTIGMRAWRLLLQNQDGTEITLPTACKRLLFTLLGLGNLRVLFDRRHKLSLQDKLTNTEVVVLSVAANRAAMG
ncbi:RDD family protein [Thalassotalea ponticola]|uniref:RDD family protein n=1 Tax=Thalassotalea ponticola TaxID=1523392 RepID=UPI0025B3302E|nr:RDD family protein [Thalassotalea ponticola]MDN3652064.1 RDD family protein [Thalassotalea ponticola]